MSKTWIEDPMERPNFTAVVKSLASLMKYDGDIDEDLRKETANCSARHKYHQVEIPIGQCQSSVAGSEDQENIYSEVEESDRSQDKLVHVPVEYEVPVLISQSPVIPVDYEIPQKIPPHSIPTPSNSIPASEKSVLEQNSDRSNAENHHYHTLECIRSD